VEEDDCELMLESVPWSVLDELLLLDELLVRLRNVDEEELELCELMLDWLPNSNVELDELEGIS